jgi:hypothetical protein
MLAHATPETISGSTRMPYMPGHMRTHCLQVRLRKSYFIDAVAPFAPQAIEYLVRLYRYYAQVLSAKYPISPEDRAAWKQIDENLERMVHEPDACYREVFMLVVGQKPHK